MQARKAPPTRAALPPPLPTLDFVAATRFGVPSTLPCAQYPHQPPTPSATPPPPSSELLLHVIHRNSYVIEELLYLVSHPAIYTSIFHLQHFHQLHRLHLIHSTSIHIPFHLSNISTYTISSTSLPYLIFHSVCHSSIRNLLPCPTFSPTPPTPSPPLHLNTSYFILPYTLSISLYLHQLISSISPAPAPTSMLSCPCFLKHSIHSSPPSVLHLTLIPHISFFRPHCYLSNISTSSSPVLSCSCTSSSFILPLPPPPKRCLRR